MIRRAQNCFAGLAICIVALSSCGGDEGNRAQNVAPQFTSATSVSVIENTTGAFYQASATDSNGDQLSYTLSGPDAGAFSLSSSGALSFREPPNFDLAVDGNGDNTYEVSIIVSDGRGGSANLPVSVVVSNSREGIAVTRILSGLTDAVALASNRTDAELVIGLKNGDVLTINGLDGEELSLVNVFGSFSGRNIELLGITRGLINQRIAPTLLVAARSDDGSILVIPAREFGFPIGNFTGPGSMAARVAIGFADDESIYLAIGDPEGSFAQDEDSGFGKIHKIAAAADPYAGASIRFYDFSRVASGVRAPNGITAAEGGILFSDRGAVISDEINRYSGAANLNFGWPLREGNTVRTEGGSSLIPPLLAIPLGGNARESTGIVGPIIYSGPIASLKDMVISADADGTIWTFSKSRLGANSELLPSMLEVRTEDFTPDVGAIDNPIAFATDANGTLYILDGDGEVFRVDPA